MSSYNLCMTIEYLGQFMYDKELLIFVFHEPIKRYNYSKNIVRFSDVFILYLNS